MDLPELVQAPSLRRRFAAFLYEGVLLFGVVFFAGLVYSALSQQRHAMHGRTGLAAYLFVVIGLYFLAFWTRSGQTLAMKTWHLRLVDAAGLPLTPVRALLRYLLAWLWFMPALVSVWLLDLHSGAAIAGSLLTGVVAYIAVARLNPQRQFLHDMLCGTRVITQLPVQAKP
jgi:uncharacterized RDD family membrane protein YckC